MLLVCSRRCGGGLFRTLFAEVDTDSSGEYQAHRVTQPGFVCLACGAPALDLSLVPGELAAEAEAEANESVQQVADVLCPVCETRVQLDASMECPNCGSPLEDV